MRGFYLSTLLFISLFSTVGFSALPWECTTILADPRLLNEKLKFEENGSGPSLRQVSIINSKNRQLGSIAFVYDSASQDLYISSLEVKKKYKGLGLSKLLLAYALSQNPSALTLTSQLNEKSERDFNQALAQGKTLKGAIKRTSAYKFAARLGFDKVKWVDWDEDDGFPLFRAKVGQE